MVCLKNLTFCVFHQSLVCFSVDEAKAFTELRYTELPKDNMDKEDEEAVLKVQRGLYGLLEVNLFVAIVVIDRLIIVLS